MRGDTLYAICHYPHGNQYKDAYYGVLYKADLLVSF